MMDATMRDEEAGFRFGSKREYEEQLKKILERQHSSKKNHVRNLDEEYDLLVEEYLRFCNAENGQ